MGTNFYLHEHVCPHCERSDEPLHIGKFSFRGHLDHKPKLDTYKVSPEIPTTSPDGEY